jgi:signal transduction histidine kinase
LYGDAARLGGFDLAGGRDGDAVEVIALPDDRAEGKFESGGVTRLGAAGQLRPRQRKRAAQRLEKAQEAASLALGAVSSYLESEAELPDFFRKLSETVAGLVGARRAAFWRLSSKGLLSVQAEPFGFTAGSRMSTRTIDLSRDEPALARIVFNDQLEIDDGTCAELDEAWARHGMRGHRNSIAVSWRAGDRRIGALAAYDSRRGFTPDDAWVLRVAAMATGLMWQYREAEAELDVTVGRLEDAMAVRRHLLANVASGGDEARRRFASALHDDSLQLLTAAELQLERIRQDNGSGPHAKRLDDLASTIRKVEDSLRRLLTNVSPDDLGLQVGLNDAIRDRLETLRTHTGIETDVDVRLPADLSDGVESMVFKNIAEALTNVEKHSHATSVKVAAAVIAGGIGVEVADNGTGFVVAESLYVPGHLGLLAMRERAQMAGGWCRIASDPGAGARVEFWVPTNP